MLYYYSDYAHHLILLESPSKKGPKINDNDGGKKLGGEW